MRIIRFVCLLLFFYLFQGNMQQIWFQFLKWILIYWIFAGILCLLSEGTLIFLDLYILLGQSNRLRMSAWTFEDFNVHFLLDYLHSIILLYYSH